MTNRRMKKRLTEYLDRTKQEDMTAGGLERTIRRCTALVAERPALREEDRQSFWGFMSDVFHFEGIPILLAETAVLAVTCLVAGSSSMSPYMLPMYMPLFILAVVPAFFRGQLHRVSEVEAATRVSGPQLALARLILAGGASLVCVTFLLAFEVWLQRSFENMGRMVLYCLVPYLTCLTTMLALIRSRRRDGASISVGVALGSVAFWRCSALMFPWLYEASALGIWIAAVVLYAWLFAKEVVFILRARGEINMYGVADR